VAKKPTQARKAAKPAAKPKPKKLRQLGRVLVINTGNTSSKLAIFQDEKLVKEENLTFTPPEGAKKVIEELPSRLEQVREFLKVIGVEVEKMAAVVARGGLLAPLKAGVFRVNDKMLDDLSNAKYGDHASNLSALIASELVKGTGISAYIVDPVTVDEFPDVARISGFPGIVRTSRLHALNIRAVAKAAAKKLGIPFTKVNFVVAHLGSGFTLASIKQGKLIDNGDALLGEGPFSIERVGVLPMRGLVKVAYDQLAEELKKALASGPADTNAAIAGAFKTAETNLKRILTKKGGLAGYLRTNDFKKVIQMVEAGDKKAELIYSAMVYQVSKNIGMYSVPLGGKHHAILLTGGLMNSKRLAADLKKSIGWLGKVMVFPGENEMGALASGAYAALSGEEPIQMYEG
jgi:butyrate kinase